MNRFSRNPAYLGDLLVTLGVALLTGAGVSLVAPVLFFLVVNAIVIPVEEQALRQVFGADYEQYQREVRRWL